MLTKNTTISDLKINFKNKIKVWFSLQVSIKFSSHPNKIHYSDQVKDIYLKHKISKRPGYTTLI